ncbi:MAG: ATP-binding cassette domain-containing protein, partial [Desulfatiglandales bacterium]
MTKRFSSVVAVDDLTLKLKAGTLFGFLGPNGAGKTTTIKMLVGIMKPTKGRIEVLGMDISKRGQEVKRCLGYIPDRPYLYEKLTGAEFIS